VSADALQLDPPLTAEERRVVSEVLAAIRSVSHGTVTIVVQDRRVVQLERLEKRRFS
jgi:hypothetical protein